MAYLRLLCRPAMGPLPLQQPRCDEGRNSAVALVAASQLVVAFAPQRPFCPAIIGHIDMSFMATRPSLFFGIESNMAS